MPVSTKDAVVANLLRVGSALEGLLPVRLKFVGKANVPSYTPLHWRHANRAADMTRWLTFERQDLADARRAGRTPRHYGQAGILQIDRETMDAFIHSFDASHAAIRPAVAYRLGTTIMYGISKHQEIFGLEHPNADDYQVAMRIGNEPLEAQTGIEIAVNGRRSYLPQVKGVRAGEILPVSEVPSYIPVV